VAGVAFALRKGDVGVLARRLARDGGQRAVLVGVRPLLEKGNNVIALHPPRDEKVPF